jgi:hypothetical protein
MTHSEGEITILGGESTIFHRLLSGNQTWQWEIPNLPIKTSLIDDFFQLQCLIARW